WEGPEEDTREPFEIRPANSVWGQGGCPFLDEYLGTLARHYGAGLRLVDYAGDPDGARRLINEWTAEATEGRIQDLIPPGATAELTRLVLVNAIWFHANWVNQFDPDLTEDGPFTLLDGNQVTVPFMKSAAMKTGYAENPRFQAVRLPYTGDAAMVVALPRNGSLSELAAELGPADMDLEWDTRLVDLTLPKFEFETQLPLGDALKELGIKEAFVPPSEDAGADFTRMTPERVLFLSAALHQSFVAVDEFGTEAAAATAMVMSATSAPMPAEFRADRPFLFWIEHTPTGEPVSLGQASDPSS